MAGGNLSPRQKMIGMMYLVLTALLALNVSKDILEAFVLVNDGLETTTSNFSKKNEMTYSAFDFAKKNNEVKVAKYWTKAQQTRKLSKELTQYIEELKKQLVMKADGLPKEVADTMHLQYLNAKDNMDIPGEILIGSTADGSTGKARELKLKIEAYRKSLYDLLKDVSGGDKVDLGLETKNPPPSAEHGTQTWETHNFDHVPLAAVITILSKIQSDVKNAEADAINHLYSQIDAADFKFDTLVARVIAPSSYVLLGNEYTADVMVAAYSSTQDPEVLVGGSAIPVEGGMGKYTVRPSKEGINKWGGVVKVKAPDGSVKEYPFESEYTAARPSTVISPTKMNVLYIGVPNPVSISVPGISADKVKATITQGVLKPDKEQGSYLAEVKTIGEATINVAAEIGGKVQQMGSMKFRVKIVPDPVAKVANMKGGNINRSVLAAQNAVIPVLENFEFDLNFIVTSFSMTRSGKGRDPVEEKSDNNLLTSSMKDLIKNTRSGDKIYFEYIKAKGPDGTTRSLSSVSFTIQ
jgi:gliding motility-associated protein GldM